MCITLASHLLAQYVKHVFVEKISKVRRSLDRRYIFISWLNKWTKTLADLS